jgi:RNase P protein component
VYSIIGGLLPSLPSGGIIFFARKGVDKLSYQALKSEIIALLKDSDFYKK